MSEFAKAHRRSDCLVAICLMVLSCGAATNALAQKIDHVLLAQKIVQAAFPELSGDISIMLEPAAAEDWRFAPLTVVSIRRFDPSSPSHSRDVLTVNIQARDGVLSEASFFGDNIDGDRQRAFKDAQLLGGDIAANVATVWRKRGAKYGPGDAERLLTAINVQRFAAVIGRIQSANAHLVAVPTVGFDRDGVLAHLGC